MCLQVYMSDRRPATGERTCVMVRGLNTSVESELGWLASFCER